MENLNFLINYLLEESNQVNQIVPTDIEEKKKFYRALVNVRPAKPISSKFLKAEDEYLQEELKDKKITDVKELLTIKEKYVDSNLNNSEKMCIWQGDITKLKVGAIVNAGNSQGIGCFVPNHNCIDNQINTYAGVRLRLACDDIMKGMDYNLQTGQTIITEGYNLPAKNVIQTVGPVIENIVTIKEEQELANCYINSLKLAIQNKIRTIAFPCISTGLFRFPKELASKIAINTVDRFLEDNNSKFDKIVFNVWSDEDVNIYEQNIRRIG